MGEMFRLAPTSYQLAIQPTLIRQPTTTGAHNNSKANSTMLNTIKENISTSSNVSTNLRQSTSTFAYTSNYNNNNSKPLSISIKSSQNIVNGNGRSNVTATAYDSITGKKLDNATVKLRITFPSNSSSKEIVSHNGQATYNTELNQNSKNNNYNATVGASAPGNFNNKYNDIFINIDNDI